MNDQRNRVATSKKFTPWTALPVMFVGGLAGAGLSKLLGASDPWNMVIGAAAVAAVLLLGWVVLNLAHRQRSSK